MSATFGARCAERIWTCQVSEVVSRSSMVAFQPTLARLSGRPQEPSDKALPDTFAMRNMQISRSAADLDAVSPPETPISSPMKTPPRVGTESSLSADARSIVRDPARSCPRE